MSRYEIHRVLYPLTKNIRSYDIPLALKSLGYEPLLCDIPCEAASDSREHIDRLMQEIDRQQADAVITHNFMIFAALACAVKKIPYIAWSWDAPDIPLYHESAALPTSFLFDFDRLQAAESEARGCPHVFHQPLAVNLNHSGALEITPEDEERFGCDVSFIGALYSDSDYIIPDDAGEEIRNEADSIIAGAAGIWDGTDRISGRLPDDMIVKLGENLAAKGKHTSEGVPLAVQRRSLEMRMLSRRAAFYERSTILEKLAGQGFDLQFYTTAGDLPVKIPGVESRPSLHYYNEVPKAYYLSKVNINITLHSIRSGVPLRVFDILGAGGFLLSNYQPELEELFLIGSELDVFHDPDELMYKTAYYLSHDEVRQRMAINGYKKVREQYTYEKQLAKILEKVSETECWEGTLELT